MRLMIACLAVLASCVSVAEAGRSRALSRSRVVQMCCTSQATSCCASESTATLTTKTRQVTESCASDCAGGVCRSRTVTTTRTTGCTAQAKAERLASFGSIHHVSGAFVGGSLEGVGMGATREEAIANCCFWGLRAPVDIGAAQAANGQWFATVFYR
jgi:hypothetical protein